jgi:hypothetical protein
VELLSGAAPAPRRLPARSKDRKEVPMAPSYTLMKLTKVED